MALLKFFQLPKHQQFEYKKLIQFSVKSGSCDQYNGFSHCFAILTDAENHGSQRGTIDVECQQVAGLPEKVFEQDRTARDGIRRNDEVPEPVVVIAGNPVFAFRARVVPLLVEGEVLKDPLTGLAHGRSESCDL